MDQQLKERLVGAVVLVVAGVVFIPMILSGGSTDEPAEAARDSDPPAAVASAPSSFSSRIEPAGGARADAAEPKAVIEERSESPRASATTADASEPSASSDTPSVPAAHPAAPPKRPTRTASASPAKPATPKPTQSKPAAERKQAPGRGWVVQLGSFSSERNANGLRERLRKKGYRAFVESVTHEGARVTRVFVGPQPSKEKSKAALDGLYKETGLKGIVVRHGS